MKTILIGALCVALAFSYLAWLNSGCESAGVMTWEGKKCLEDITR